MTASDGSSTVAATVAWQWKCRVDSVCERFEDAWRDGGEPRIEAFLDDPSVSPARRAALLAELLKVERELRQNRGDKPIAGEYLARFPAYAMVVRSIFGEDHVGDYDLIAPIGEGGMGVVYHARHRKIGREVALKMIRPHYLDDAAAIERFRLEAQLAARLEHEHIVTVYEAGQADGHHYYAMRYIVGQSLSEVIGKKPMDESRASRYLEQVARAVDFAHTHDVLHRDLKPRNILIDARDRAVVTDFGLAKILNKGTGATRTDDRLGTPPYMSPEQVRDPSRAGVASDVYSLGATLYEALTGRAPFLAENPLEIYRQILDAEPTPPRHLNKRCGRDLETICLKCLEKDPGRRYASALQLAEDLNRARDRAPILARRVGPVERLRKMARRHPTAAALVAVSAVAAVAIAGVYETRRTNAFLARYDARGRTAVDTLIQFCETHLGDQPEAKREALMIALDYYKDFLKDRADDPELTDYVAATFTRVARLNTQLGSRDEALKAHRQALALRRRLVARAPDDRQGKSELAETLHEMGILLLGQGDRDAAIVSYQEALSIREALVEADPKCREFLRGEPSPPVLSARDRALVGDLARSHGYIGDWEREGGNRAAAWRSYEKAQILRARLHETDPSDLLATFQLARSENNAGVFHREEGRPHESIAAHTRALALQQELVDTDPEEARSRLSQLFGASGRLPDVEYDDFRSDWAATENHLGVLYASQGMQEAIEYHVNAESRYEALAMEHPGLARWDANRAWTATYLGELRGSDADLKRGLEIFEKLLATDPSDPRVRSGWARNVFDHGEAARRAGNLGQAKTLWMMAREVQQQLVREQPRNGDFRVDLEKTLAALASSETKTASEK